MAMGSPDYYPPELKEAVKLTLNRVRISRYGYEIGSPDTYWGSGEPLYLASGDTKDGDAVQIYTRATHRHAAKANIRYKLPNVTFYR